MKKNRNQIVLMLAFFALALFSFKPFADTYKVDASASSVEWTGSHILKGYDHVGLVPVKSGELQVEGGKITGGTIVLNMAALSNTDLTDTKKNAKLVGHLKSDDFFGTESHPEAKIVITGVSGNTISADVTIKGKTDSISFDADVSTDKGKVTAEAAFSIDRTKFDVKYGSSILGDIVLADEFKLKVKLVAKK